MSPEQRIEAIAQQLPGLSGSQRRLILNHLHSAARREDGDSQPESAGPFSGSSPREIGAAMQGPFLAQRSARSLLEHRVHGLRAEAADLEALLKALPAELPRTADAALRHLIQK